jgi:REP element-mobilizing transposase RayT
MPRANRFHPAGIHHIVARGCMRMPIFATAASREAFVDRLALALEAQPVRAISYCVMPNHIHLLLITDEEGSLSEPMRESLGAYAAWYKSKYGHEGHVFERRFRSVECRSDRHIDEACRYIAMNPVRAGLSRNAFEYPWSSFLQNIGLVEPRSFLQSDWMEERFGRLGAWPDDFIAFVHRADAPDDLSLFEDPHCVELMDNPSLEGILRAHAAGVSARKIARIVGCSHQTILRRIAAEVDHLGRGPSWSK